VRSLKIFRVLTSNFILAYECHRSTGSGVSSSAFSPFSFSSKRSFGKKSGCIRRNRYLERTRCFLGKAQAAKTHLYSKRRGNFLTESIPKSEEIRDDAMKFDVFGVLGVYWESGPMLLSGKSAEKQFLSMPIAVSVFEEVCGQQTVELALYFAAGFASAAVLLDSDRTFPKDKKARGALKNQSRIIPG